MKSFLQRAKSIQLVLSTIHATSVRPGKGVVFHIRKRFSFSVILRREFELIRFQKNIVRFKISQMELEDTFNGRLYILQLLD